ncbi:MAG: glutamate 5-kinase [Bacteriovoracaceae bacterium]|nr:glutamate 5-kinase [Bacteriovoracaceae bacterium]
MKQRIVVKIGSLGVTNPLGGLEMAKIEALSRDLMKMKSLGHEIILVSSGAINTGRPHIQKPHEKQLSLAWQQACASVGMPLLMSAYQSHLTSPCAQVLVTHDDFKSRPRFLNIRNTLLTLLSNNVLPIVNENDTVSTSEITVGDNDQLAAMIAEAIGADKLILLTEADGLFDRDPKDPEAKHFPVIDFRDDFAQIKTSTKTSVGRGGMQTKLQAVRRLTPVGLDVVIATFNRPHPISSAFNGSGTLFKADPREKVKKRLSWIATVVRAQCAIVIDEGAAKVLKEGKSSLLPVGIKKITGTFKRGDVIAVKFQQKTVALGIVEYDSKEMSKIAGKKSQAIDEIFEVVPSYVAIHKDNLFLPKE